MAEMVNNNTLKEKNRFGNLDRFTDDKGKQDYKSGKVVDHIPKSDRIELGQKVTPLKKSVDAVLDKCKPLTNA